MIKVNVTIRQLDVGEGKVAAMMDAEVEDDSSATPTETSMKGLLFQFVKWLGEDYFPKHGAKTMVRFLDKEPDPKQKDSRK